MSPQTDPTVTSFEHVKAPNWRTGAPRTQHLGVTSFHDLRLSPELSAAVDAVGYTIPTPVQSGCIPLALAGIDLIVQSPTGSGKTAAFAIPTLELLEPGKRRVEALILCPTRELAKQVAGEFERLGAPKGITAATVYGGTGFAKQVKDLETAQVVCATPGRLLDLLQRKTITLKHLKVFILDEADEMLNMGFEKELDAIVERLPPIRQNLLFSATVTEDIKNLAAHILTWPEFLTFSEEKVAAEEIHHAFYMVSGMGRLRDLLKVLEFEAPDNAIIFANTREDTVVVTNFLKTHGYNAEVLNGDLPQNEREATLGKLRANEIDFLVATDVAARGIDISDLGHVINLNLPESPEVYVHRTGRTGRAGRTGIALSLISPREIGVYYILRRVFKIAFEERAMPDPAAIKARREERALQKLLTRLERQQGLAWGEQLPFAERLLAEADARTWVARLLAYFTAGKEDFTLSAILPLRPVRNDATPARLRPIERPAPPAPAPAVLPEIKIDLDAEEDEDDDEEEDEASAASSGDDEPSLDSQDDSSDDASSDDEGDEEEEEEVEVRVEPPPAERPGRERRGREERRGRREDEPRAEERRSEPRVEREERRDDRRDDRRAGGEAREEERGGEGRRERRDRRSRREDEPRAEERREREERRDDRRAGGEAREEERVERSGEGRRERRDRRSRREDEPRGEERSSGKRLRTFDEDDREIDVGSVELVTEDGMVKLHLNVGSGRLKDEDSVVQLVCELANISPDECGAVTLRRRFSYIQVREEKAHAIIEALTGQTVAGIDLKAAVARR